MDTETLVENRIDEGQKLIEELAKSGFEVSAAFWLNASQDGKWRFHVVSPVVDTAGIGEAYRQLHPLVWSRPQTGSIDPLAVRLVGPSDAVARDVLDALSRAPGPRGSPIRWRGRVLGNVIVEGAYLYPPPVTTP